MADLDEALFSVAGVLDFSAKLTREDGSDVLRISVDVAAIAAGELSVELRDALDRVPACQSDRLHINLQVQTGKTSTLRTMGKRAIVDERPHSDALLASEGLAQAQTFPVKSRERKR